MNAHVDDLMGLGEPGLVLDVAPDGLLATVDLFGARRVIRLDLLDGPIVPGDYVLNHVGYAIRRIPAHHLAETLAAYERLLRDASDTGDADLGARPAYAGAGEGRDE